MLVDFARFSVFSQQSSQDTHSAHPEDRGGHTGISSTTTFTVTIVTTFTFSSQFFTNTEARVDGFGFTNDETVFDQFTDVLSWLKSFKKKGMVMSFLGFLNIV